MSEQDLIDLRTDVNDIEGLIESVNDRVRGTEDRLSHFIDRELPYIKSSLDTCNSKLDSLLSSLAPHQKDQALDTQRNELRLDALTDRVTVVEGGHADQGKLNLKLAGAGASGGAAIAMMIEAVKLIAGI